MNLLNNLSISNDNQNAANFSFGSITKQCCNNVSNAINIISNIFDKTKNVNESADLNGIIDNPIYQGTAGDCALLSTALSLNNKTNYTFDKEGKITGINWRGLNEITKFSVEEISEA